MATSARRADTSSSRPLALAWGALIVYASLYPFTAWRWPPGADLLRLLWLPWPRWIDRFDVAANLLGYLPLGGLVYVASVRGGATRWGAWARAAMVGAALSYLLEVTQVLLPQRVPSALDWTLNGAGALLGATLAALLHRLGVLGWLRTAVNRWLHRGGSGAMLLLLWPVGLLFPTSVPLGLGQVGTHVREAMESALADVPWAASLLSWLEEIEPVVSPLSPAAEWLAIALGLLGPCLVAFAATHPGWRRLPLVLGALVLGVGVTTLSTAMNFGPEHALAWRTVTSVPALLTGLAMALLLAQVGPRLAAGLGLLAITVMLVLVAQAPADPYFAQSLHAWEQGRFIHFHGAAQWVGWLWPYAALLWLLHRVAAGE